eukprot:m.221939 g.221939  ORF g.221939 m.221939 type:complete len:378 (+) comp18729_c2_seq2:943-2076(+)
MTAILSSRAVMRALRPSAMVVRATATRAAPSLASSMVAARSWGTAPAPVPALPSTEHKPFASGVHVYQYRRQQLQSAKPQRSASQRRLRSGGVAVSAKPATEAAAQPACLTTSGRKQFNEDRSQMFTDGDTDTFAVFDGHSGPHAAEFASSHLRDAVAQCRATQKDSANLEALAEGVIHSIDVGFRAEALPTPDRCRTGTTANLVLRRGRELVVANTGDSRAVLYGAEGLPRPLSEDHRPSLDSEADRIHAAGGKITRNRVNGTLAMTRALGAYFLRSSGVISNPDVMSHAVSDEDCFVLLATDGLFDFVSNAEACETVRMSVSPEDAVHSLVDLALAYGSSDNVTAMVIPLPNWQNRAACPPTSPVPQRNLCLRSS